MIIMLTTVNKRRQEKILTVAGQVPTVPTVADHTLPGWLSTDIYIGEICINRVDNLLWTRTNAGIIGPFVKNADMVAALAGKSNTGHTHDDRYYTEAEIIALLAGKSDLSHQHVEADITDLDKYTQAQVDALFTALKDGVPVEGDSLQKLYNLIITNSNSFVAADIAARDLLDINKVTDKVLVNDDGDGNWALYMATSTGVGATFVKISDPDLLNAVMTAEQIKIAYESNPDTNAFTNALKSKLDGIESGATANATNAQLRDRSTHTGTQLAATISDFAAAVTQINTISRLLPQAAQAISSESGEVIWDVTSNVRARLTMGESTELLFPEGLQAGDELTLEVVTDGSSALAFTRDTGFYLISGQTVDLDGSQPAGEEHIYTFRANENATELLIIYSGKKEEITT